MAWIEFHQELRDHPKVWKLAEYLKIPQPYALGLLGNLWLWATSFAPHGDLASFPADYIAKGCVWDGPGAKLVTALKKAGWLDSDGKLHDWGEHRLFFDAHRERAARVRDQTRDRVRSFRERERRKDGDGAALATEEPAPRGVGGDADVTRYSNGGNENGNGSNAPNIKNVPERTESPLPPKGGQGRDGPEAGGQGQGGAALAEVMDGFTLILDQNIGDENWRTVYGRTISRHSKKLLTLFGGDAGKALDCIEGVVKHAKARGWPDWTPKTIVDRAGDWAVGRMGAK